jgi:hypothetical protein
MEDDYLKTCVVDPVSRTFLLYSESGKEKTVTCETVEEFMNALAFVRTTLKDEESLKYKMP